MNSHSRANATQHRQRRAYNLVKMMAIAAGYMRSINDIDGFNRYVDRMDSRYAANKRVAQPDDK